MREKHTFKFRAKVIADAAQEEASYHREREGYWRIEYEESWAKVKQTAHIEFRESQHTNGSHMEAYVDYGDPMAILRANEAKSKIESHRQAAERYETDARVYGTQQDTYELSTDDVHYFRLGGEPRES
jgi:hypothetical protein